jgi:GLPGLI family protein
MRILLFIYLRRPNNNFTMKKLQGFISFFLVLAGLVTLISCHNTNSSSAPDFEGVVSYEVDGGKGMPPEASSMLQSMVIKTYVKGSMTRSQEEIAGNKNIIIADSKKPNDPIMLVTMFGHKYAVRLNDSLKKLAEKNAPKIDYDDSPGSTKQIAGYNCKKAKITIVVPPNDSSITSEVYYTTDLPYADPQGQFKGLKGMPMEFNINMSGLNLIITTKSVEKQSLSDSLFTIPAGYKEMGIDDIKRELQSSMQSQAGGSDSAAGSK